MAWRAHLAALLVLAGWGPLSAQDTLLTHARRQVAAGDFRAATETYQRLLDRRPHDPLVLAGLADALEADGRWRTAMPVLDRLLRLRPDDSARLRQRGLYAAWSGDGELALSHLREAARLRPGDPDFLLSLAEVLSWAPKTRAEAEVTFERAHGLDSTRADVLAAFGELLSWSSSSRDRAESLFRRALERAPRDARARTGLANLRAWRGEPAPALREYEAVLADSSTYVPALRGKGAALNELGRHQAAHKTLTEALALAPDDPTTRREMARAELALASFGEVGGLARRRRDQLDATGLGFRASIAVTPSLRLEGRFEPTEYRDALGTFRAEAYGLGVESRSANVRLTLGGRFRSVDGPGTQWDGGAKLDYGISGVLGLRVAADREPIEETRDAVLTGVHSNLATLGVDLPKLPGPFDAWLTVIGGSYSAPRLDVNRRLGAEAQLGLVLRRHQPRLRVAYGFFGTTFDYNADTSFATTAAHRGGYFSPDQYWLNQAVVQVAQRFGSRVVWEAEGRLGRESVRQLAGGGTDERAAGGLHSSLTVRLTSGLALEVRYLYSNAFDAFRMSELRAAVRGYVK